MFALAALQVLQQHTPSVDTAVRMFAVQIQKYCIEKLPGFVEPCKTVLVRNSSASRLSIFFSSPTEFTLCGTAFVVDIHLAPSTGSLQSLKFSYALPDGTTVDDLRLSQFLLNQLQLPSFTPFATQIAHLHALDTLSTPTLNTFTLHSQLFTDISKIHALERAHALKGSGNASLEAWAFSVHPMVAVLLHGHGVVVDGGRGRGGWGVVYFVERAAVLDVDWNGKGVTGVDGDVWSVGIGFSESDKWGGRTLEILSDGDGYFVDDAGKSGGVVVSSLNGLGVGFRKGVGGTANVCFTLELDPPVSCTVEYWNKILALSGGPITKESVTALSKGSLLESLLPFYSRAAVNQTSKYHLLSHAPAIHSKLRFTTPSTDSKAVATIPFTNPSQILPILNCLRRQVVFNTLVSSLYSPPPKTSTKTTMHSVIEVTAWNPPESMTVCVAVIGRGVFVLQVEVMEGLNIPVVKIVQGDVVKKAVESCNAFVAGTLDLGLGILCFA